LGEAKVHRKIEFKAWEVSDPREQQGFENTKFEELDPVQQNACYVYSGNWMRDWSQLYAPKFFSVLTSLPKQWYLEESISSYSPLNYSEAAEVITGLLRAFGVMEFDQEITDKVITAENISVYKSEEHMDNPVAYVKADFILRGEQGEYLLGSDMDADAYWQQTMSSSAFPNTLQIDSSLQKIGPLGISNYIYNTNEWIKKTFQRALEEPDPNIKRMLFGTAFHGIEDYYAHSNFIEIALNLLIDLSEKYDINRSYKQLPKDDFLRRVDTLFDKDLKKPRLGKNNDSVDEYYAIVRRYPVVTGVFEDIDLVVSLGHLILSKVDEIGKWIDKGVDIMLDEILNIVAENERSNLEKALSKKARKEDPGTYEEKWHKFEEKLKEDRFGRAFNEFLKGLDNSGLEIFSFKTFDAPEERPKGIPDWVIPDDVEERIWGGENPYWFYYRKTFKGV